MTKKTSTSETPFLLTYATKAIIPAEIECPSHRVVYYTSEGNEQGLMINLDFLEESHLIVVVRNEACRLKATQYHNVKVKNRRFKFGDLVLRKLEATGKRESRGKLALK